MTDTTPVYTTRGRPTLLTRELADRIVQVVSAGNYLKTAAQFAGVGQSTLMSWLARGRAASAAVQTHDPAKLYCPACDADRTTAAQDRCPSCFSEEHPRTWELPPAELPYLDFLERVTQAETQAEVAAITHWRRAFADDWRAARDYVARKRPDQWAAKTTVAISSEEAEARIEAATLEALTALGVDTDGMGLDDLDTGEPAEEPTDP